MRDFLFQQLLPLLSGPLQVVLMALAAAVAVKIRAYVHNKTLADMLVTLDRYAAGAVADVYQRTVKTAKSEGGWDQKAQQAARDAALAQVRQLAPAILASLKAAGEDVDATLGQMVEKAVVELNAKVASGATPVTP